MTEQTPRIPTIDAPELDFEGRSQRWRITKILTMAWTQYGELHVTCHTTQKDEENRLITVVYAGRRDVNRHIKNRCEPAPQFELWAFLNDSEEFTEMYWGQAN